MLCSTYNDPCTSALYLELILTLSEFVQVLCIQMITSGKDTLYNSSAFTT